MKSIKYLEMAKAKKNLKTDAELAAALNVTKAAVSQYMSGKRIIENETCLALALMIDTDPMPIIMAADIDRAERSGQRSMWESFLRHAGATGMAAFVAVNLFLSPTPSNAAPDMKVAKRTLYIM